MPLTKSELLMERARNLAPVLRERAAETDRLGRLPDATIADLISTDLLKCLTPERFGGYGLDWRVSARVVQEVASGCGSSGWVLNAYCCTAWLISLFPLATQELIFGGKGYVLGPCPLNARLGQARKVEGGYRISARAAFASGIYHSEWAVACATVERDPASSTDHVGPTAIFFAVPRSDYEFDPSGWSVLGARGTGSSTLVMNDVLVPDSRVLDNDDVLNGTTPGAALHRSPVYKTPMVPCILLATAASLVGVAEDSVAAFREQVRSRVFALSGDSQLQTTAAQMRLADAASNADAAALILAASLEEMTRYMEDGAIPPDARAKYRLRGAFVASLCRSAVDFVKDGSGATALKNGTRIQRAFRDVHMMSGNHGLQSDSVRELYGRFALGLPYTAGDI
jgi:3-hydroxy-9,10-secoandrosta-1,3,5(10)-triene-9,17-dione monooxygenase